MLPNSNYSKSSENQGSKGIKQWLMYIPNDDTQNYLIL